MKSTLSLGQAVPHVMVLFICCLIISYPCHAATVGLWLFDEGSGDVAEDASGNGHDGQVIGAQRVDGKFSGGLEFSDGSVVKVPHSDSLSLDTYTMEAWIKIPGITGDWQGIITKDAWPQRNYGLWVINDRPQIHHSFNTGVDNITVDSTSDLADEQWHHIAATYDKQTQRTYVDGVLEAERQTTATPGINELDLSIGQGNDVQQFVGTIDEVRLSDQALTEDEVQQSLLGLGASETAVESKGKLAVSWGEIKTNY